MLTRHALFPSAHFTNRFTMPLKNESSNLYYSFDVGLIHFVSYNTEAYFNMTGNGAASGDGNDCVKTQYHWLQQDLAAANARRNTTPWIVAYGHRPMYCNVAAHNASTNATGCDDEQEQSRNGARVGMPGTTSGGEVGSSDFAVEDLLYEYGVDLAFFGHVHDYSRFLPSYNDTVLNEEFAEDLACAATSPTLWSVLFLSLTARVICGQQLHEPQGDCALYHRRRWEPGDDRLAHRLRVLRRNRLGALGGGDGRAIRLLHGRELRACGGAQREPSALPAGVCDVARGDRRAVDRGGAARQLCQPHAPPGWLALSEARLTG